jgi:predicted amidophosphoribosyltransferase
MTNDPVMMPDVLMELVTCPACKREVSSEADRCPNCGQPIKRGLLGRAATERAFNIGLLIILMIIAFFVFVGSRSGLFH